MSANVHEISPIRGADAPHDEIIAKPFDLRDFLERVTKLLGLDWAPSEAPAAPPPSTAKPRPEHVDELRRLGRIGHVRGIEAKLTQMEAEEPAPAAFVAQMRGLVASYDMRRYMSVLDGMASDV